VVDVSRDRVHDTLAVYSDAGSHLELHVSGILRPVLNEAVVWDLVLSAQIRRGGEPDPQQSGQRDRLPKESPVFV
jgi:hypothetical protein